MAGRGVAGRGVAGTGRGMAGRGMAGRDHGCTRVTVDMGHIQHTLVSVDW